LSKGCLKREIENSIKILQAVLSCPTSIAHAVYLLTKVIRCVEEYISRYAWAEKECKTASGLAGSEDRALNLGKSNLSPSIEHPNWLGVHRRKI
jgi:hypothetical protein